MQLGYLKENDPCSVHGGNKKYGQNFR